jgi:hypothetical protein
LFGTTLGWVLSNIGHYHVKPLFYSLPDKLFAQTDEGGYYAVKARQYVSAFLLLVVPLSVGGVVLLSRLAVDSEWLKDTAWMQRMKDCVGMVESAEYLNHRHFLHTGIAAAAFGSLVG